MNYCKLQTEILNQSGFFTEGNIDINEVAINLAKLKNTIGNKTKGKKH